MPSLTEISASKLRMTQFRYSKIFLSLPDISKMASGGHISIDSTIGVEVCEGDLLLTPKLVAKILQNRSGSEDQNEDEMSQVGEVALECIVTYALPDNHGFEDGELDSLEPKVVEGFVHSIEPLLVMKMRAILYESGATGINIPPHIYVPSSIEPDE